MINKNVSTRFFKTGSSSNPFRLAAGGSLPGVTIAYEMYGELNANASNAILLFHALSGNQHAAGVNTSVDGAEDFWNVSCHVGWWDAYIGPGRALDTDRFCIICANYLGGCYGSTGPSSLNPEKGKPYGGDFPAITLCDIVDSQVLLLDHLGINTLHAVIGASLGGMLCLNFSIRHPSRVKTVIPVATSLYTTPLQRIHNLEQIIAIETDPSYNGGNYYDGPRPDRGLALARIIAHKTYVSLNMMQNRANMQVIHDSELFQRYRINHPLESYLLYQGMKFVQRFDANSYLRILEAWQRFDLLSDVGAETYEDVFHACRHQKYLVISIDSDVSFYPEEQRALVEFLHDADVPHSLVVVHSTKGHDAFLIEPELFSPHLSSALETD